MKDLKAPAPVRKLGMRHLSFAVFCAAWWLVAGDTGGATRDFDHPLCGLLHNTACTAADAQQNFAASATNVQRMDTPTDPDYDKSEPDDQDAQGDTNLYNEQFYLFGFPSARTTGVLYKDPNNPRTPNAQVSGFNAAGAWKVARGRPDVVVAILDTGIRWEKNGLRTQVHLNTGELPVPNHNRAVAISDASSVPACSAFLNAYDANNDGAVNVLDYVCDDRVTVTTTADSQNRGGHGDGTHLTAEDLIVAFSDGVDTDGNGYIDDIAGWDFFNDDNDPWDQSSYFAAANHGSGRAEEAIERGNDGEGGIGVCPHCQFVPLRVWDTFVADPNNFGLAVLYAADNGVKVIEGADGATSHTAFMEQASEYAYQHGLAQTFSGDDLNTGNHNYPAAYGHAMLILGTVPDNINAVENDPISQAARAFEGLPVGNQIPVGTYFRSANTDQYGGKGSISMEGSTGSENTGKASGAAALVISAAKDAGFTLTPDETREILEQTAEDVLPGDTAGSGTPDPAQAGWDTHFGYGRVDLGKAVTVAMSGKIPPEAALTAPDWYAPLTGNTLAVTGLARTSRSSGGYHWKLEWGPGLAPTSFTTVCEGDATTPKTSFCDIDLAAVRTALASPANTVQPDSGGPTFSPAYPNPYQQQFEVRLTVTAADGTFTTPGQDRRVFTAFSDSPLRAGYPKRLGAGGESPLRYADLDGDNVPELIVPAEDGQLHVYKKDGSELPGFPVQTQTQFNAVAHAAAPGVAALAATPPREELRGPAIADLDDDGIPEIIDVAGVHLYVWEPDGSPRAGFPVAIGDNTGFDAFCKAADQRQGTNGELGAIRRKCGFIASPAIAHLNGADPTETDIVAVALDGHIYAFKPNGTAVTHFPVNLVDPGQSAANQELAESINNPAIADLDADGVDDIVVASNEAYDPETPNDPHELSGGSGALLVDALSQAAGGTSRLYAINGATGAIMPGWPVHLAGVIQTTLPLIGPGHDAAFSGGTIFTSTTGGVIAEYDATGAKIIDMNQGTYGSASNATDKSGQFNLFESVSLGDLTGGGASLSVVKYGLSLGGVSNLLLPGNNQPYNHLIGAYDSSTGQSLPAFPVITDDYQFLSASNIGNVSGSASNQVLAGTGLGPLHAYDGVSGRDANGFPKVTGGWLFAPPELSQDQRLADITREGFLFEWNVPGAPVCQDQWPTFRHDRGSSGNFDTDNTPPGAVSKMGSARTSGSGASVQWIAPGDDGLCGTADSYRVSVDGTPVTVATTPAAAGTAQNVALGGLSNAAHTITVQAVDEAGNVGYPISGSIPSIVITATSGLASVVAPANVTGGPGQAVGSGSFRLGNTGTVDHTVDSITLQLSQPGAFRSISVHGPGGLIATVDAPGANPVFNFTPGVAIAAGDGVNFTLSAVLSSSDVALRDTSWFATAYAGDGSATAAHPLVALLALLLLAALAAKLDRRLAALMLAAGLLLAGCGGGGGGNTVQHPPGPTQTLISTVDLAAVSATSAGGAVTYSGLPARLATVTRQP